MKERVYSKISQLIGAIENCKKSNNLHWLGSHSEKLMQTINNHMPSGSGFDNGTKLDFDNSTPDKLVFHTAFHHMDENGFYDGWTDHTIRVYPSLAFRTRLTVSGKDRNDIKDYIHETFDFALNQEIEI